MPPTRLQPLPSNGPIAKTGRQPLSVLFDFRVHGDERKYGSKHHLPMIRFAHMYVDGTLSTDIDLLDLLRARHGWATFRFGINHIGHLLRKVLSIETFRPSLQDQSRITEAYDQGDDLYRAFLGSTMVYSAGIVSQISQFESLDQLQQNNLHLICRKLDIRPGDTLLDVGCGYGRLVELATRQYGAFVTGITMSNNQADFGKDLLKSTDIEETQSRIMHGDAQSLPISSRFKSIACIEMAEHVGLHGMKRLFARIHTMLLPDGTFFLQIESSRNKWRGENIMWNMFVDRYIFPGSDDSANLTDYISMLENVGFEVKSVENIGAHSSATVFRWYKNWVESEDFITQQYGCRTFRQMRYFLAYSTILAEEGTITTWQLVLVKASPGTDRMGGIVSQLGTRIT